MTKASLRNYLYILYVFVLTTLVFILYMYLSENDRFSPFVSTFDPAAQKPFVYRVLPSLIINAFSLLTGAAPTFSAILFMYFSLLSFFFTYASLVKLILPKVSPFLSMLFPAVGLIPFLIKSRHVYDFPILFLFTLAYYFLERKEFGKYLIIFLLASLTKETAIFLVLFFALHFRDLGRKQFFKIIISQVLIFGIIRGILMFVFRENPGGDVQFHFSDQVNSLYSHPAAAVLLLACIASIFLVGMTTRGSFSRFIKDAFLAVGIPIAILYLLFGVPFEIRVFLEVFPVISILFTLKIIDLIVKIKSKTKRILDLDE
ncbi:MAG TPA: hypothetical protein DIW44_10100 [Anaerolineaceae bacterium]|nr:hypothetical protein [Anaerolineaceae bacterium]